MPSVADLQLVIVGDELPSGAMAWSDLAAQRDDSFTPVARKADDALLVGVLAFSPMLSNFGLVGSVISRLE